MEKFENFYLLEEDQVNHYGLPSCTLLTWCTGAYILCHLHWTLKNHKQFLLLFDLVSDFVRHSMHAAKKSNMAGYLCKPPDLYIS